MVVLCLAMIQAKSSLLSIWGDHMKLSASRLHEEFVGRKLAVEGKFELYQKESTRYLLRS